ncbi:MAG: ABC transporter substrate-binding protein [Aminivibrio sp.]|jgi:iron complex transport system substrate-binding protein
MARRVAFVLIILFLTWAGAGGAASITDDSGREISLTSPPGRIVSLYAGHSENILALGGGELLVGVSVADDPALFPGAAVLPARPDGERILALAPDLVLIRPMNEASLGRTIRLLEESGVAVASLAPPTWDGMEDYLARLGELTGIQGGENLWREKLAALEKAPPAGERPRVFLESSSRGLMTCSPSSWAARMIELAGGLNAAPGAEPVRPGSPLAPFGTERLLALAEEGLDFYLVQVGPMNNVTEGEVLARPWIPALGGAAVALVPEELVSRPSLLRLEEGAKLLARIFSSEGRMSD